MKTAIATTKAPKAIGPYSQAVETRGNRMLWLSGQIPLDPATGELVQGGIEEQTRRVMENLSAVLAQAGGTIAHLVRTTLYLADLRDFAKVNEVYGSFLGEVRPARSTVQVAALPRGARIEIDGIAVLE